MNDQKGNQRVRWPKTKEDGILLLRAHDWLRQQKPIAIHKVLDLVGWTSDTQVIDWHNSCSEEFRQQHPLTCWTSEAKQELYEQNTIRVVTPRMDKLFNWWVVYNWTLEETVGWICYAFPNLKAKRNEILKHKELNGKYLLNTKKFETTWFRSIGATQKNVTDFQRSVSDWQDNMLQTFEFGFSELNRFPLVLEDGMQSILNKKYDAFDPPVGDGQCQVRAAQNAVFLNDDNIKQRCVQYGYYWHSEMNAFDKFRCSPRHFDIEYIETDTKIHYLLCCYLLSIGKETMSQKANEGKEKEAQSISQALITNTKKFANALTKNDLHDADNALKEAEFMIRILRDYVSRQSIRFLRQSVKEMLRKDRYSIFSWWTPERAETIFTGHLVAYVRGGWPSVPMFWSYATLLEQLWTNTPIIIKTSTGQTQYLNATFQDRHKHTTAAWMIEGYTRQKRKTHFTVDHLLFSAADHPQYPVETHSEVHQKALKQTDEQLLAAIKPAFMEHLKSYSLPRDLLLDLVSMQHMATEKPESKTILTPYEMYRVKAAKAGCSFANPEMLVIQHVYVGHVHDLLMDDDLFGHILNPDVKSCIVSFC